MRLSLLLILALVPLCLAGTRAPRLSHEGFHERGLRASQVTSGFPYACFQIGNFPDVTYLNTSSGTDSYGDAFYYGQTFLKGQPYAAAYAHVQNSTGLVHIILTYNGFGVRNVTRAILIESGGSGGGSFATTYMVNNLAYGFTQPPQDVTVVPCGSTAAASLSTSEIGSGHASVQLERAAPRAHARLALTDAPTQAGTYCLRISRYSADNMYLNVTSVNGDGNSILQGADFYNTNTLEGYMYAIVATTADSVFFLSTYSTSNTVRVTNAILTDPKGWTSFGPMITYGVQNAAVGSYYDGPTVETDLTDC